MSSAAIMHPSAIMSPAARNDVALTMNLVDPRVAT